MANDILAPIYDQLLSEHESVFQKAENILDRKITGKLVRLEFPRLKDSQSRKDEVTGVVKSVAVESYIEENMIFAIWIEFEDGEMYLDPAAIEIKETEQEDYSWRRVEDRLPPRRFGNQSKKMEVSLKNGGREFDHYNFEQSRWVEFSGQVEHWKPIEPDPNQK